MSARIAAMAALVVGLTLGTACGTCIGTTPPTCDPADTPRSGEISLGASCADGLCAEQATLFVADAETTLRYLDDDGNAWIVTWER